MARTARFSARLDIVIFGACIILSLIAIWNDGDSLLGEPLAPYVHARDAALIRQEQQGSALVIAGHTRTTEVQRLIEVGYVRELGLARPRLRPARVAEYE